MPEVPTSEFDPRLSASEQLFEKVAQLIVSNVEVTARTAIAVDADVQQRVMEQEAEEVRH